MKRPALDISTYEIWMIDHFDGNLSSSEQDELRAFSLAHPELEIALDEELPQLVPMVESNLDQEDLRAIAMEFSAFEYVEGDITWDEALEKGNWPSEDLSAAASSFKAIQLKPIASQVFPDHGLLKQEKQGRVIPLWFYQAAAAASVLLAVILLWPDQPAPQYASRPNTQIRPTEQLEMLTEETSIPETLALQSPEAVTDELLARTGGQTPQMASSRDQKKRVQEADPMMDQAENGREQFAMIEALPLRRLDKYASTDVEQYIPSLKMPSDMDFAIEPKNSSASEEASESNSTGTMKSFDSPLAYARYLAEKQDLLALEMGPKNDGGYRQTKVSFRSFEFSLKRRQ